MGWEGYPEPAPGPEDPGTSQVLVAVSPADTHRRLPVGRLASPIHNHRHTAPSKNRKSEGGFHDNASCATPQNEGCRCDRFEYSSCPYSRRSATFSCSSRSEPPAGRRHCESASVTLPRVSAPGLQKAERPNHRVCAVQGRARERPSPRLFWHVGRRRRTVLTQVRAIAAQSAVAGSVCGGCFWREADNTTHNAMRGAAITGDAARALSAWSVFRRLKERMNSGSEIDTKTFASWIREYGYTGKGVKIAVVDLVLTIRTIFADSYLKLRR